MLPAIGDGPLEQRIDDFVRSRLTVHEQFGAVYRASVANAPRHPSIRDQLARGRHDMRDQFAAQFAPELSSRRGVDRDAVLSAGDVLTQMQSIDYLRRDRRLTIAETHATLAASLRTVLA